MNFESLQSVTELMVINDQSSSVTSSAVDNLVLKFLAYLTQLLPSSVKHRENAFNGMVKHLRSCCSIRYLLTNTSRKQCSQ